MTTIAKPVIPNKSWLLEDNGHKIGTLNKERSKYTLIKNGTSINVGTVKDIKEKFDIVFYDAAIKTELTQKEHSVYDYPCSTKPYGSVYNIKKKLPIYAKSSKSKSQYCAGYYVIQFRKGWVKSYCPKLITLERYPFQGPFKTEQEMKQALAALGKKDNETN
jgi:hypothetical protein